MRRQLDRFDFRIGPTTVALVKSTDDDRLWCAHTMRFSSFRRLCVQQKTKIAWCEPGFKFIKNSSLHIPYATALTQLSVLLVPPVLSVSFLSAPLYILGNNVSCEQPFCPCSHLLCDIDVSTLSCPRSNE